MVSVTATLSPEPVPDQQPEAAITETRYGACAASSGPRQYFTPTGQPAFPWSITDTGLAGVAAAAVHYNVPQQALVSVNDLLSYTGPNGPTCKHLAPARAPAVVSRSTTDVCAPCAELRKAESSTDEWVELEAAVTLVHRTAWLREHPSAAAAHLVTWIADEVEEALRYPKYTDAMRRLTPLLADARQAVTAAPGGIDWEPWIRAAVTWPYTDEVSLWVDAATAGASDDQAAAYCSWWGVTPSGYGSAPVPARSEPTQYMYTRRPDADEYWEPSVTARLASMLGGRNKNTIAAVPEHAAQAVTRLLALLALRDTGVIDRRHLNAAGDTAATDHIAQAASQMWNSAESLPTYMASAYDCLDVAITLADEPIALDTAMRLTREWDGTGVQLTATARSLAKTTLERVPPARTVHQSTKRPAGRTAGR
jgi:hypothetical protein